MQEALIPLNSQIMPDGHRRKWFSGTHPWSEFPDALAVQIIDGLTGKETQVDYRFHPKTVATIKVVGDTPRD
jgi:hypothetical protein